MRVRQRPTEQAHLAVAAAGVDVHDPRRPALRLASTVLGEGMSSRLFQEVREARGLAYTVFSFLGSFTDAGIVGAYVGTTRGACTRRPTCCAHELVRLADTLTVEEVERARSALTGGMVLGLEDPASRMMRLGTLAMTDRPLLTVDEAIARLDAVTLDEVVGRRTAVRRPARRRRRRPLRRGPRRLRRQCPLTRPPRHRPSRGSWSPTSPGCWPARWRR